MRYDSNPRDSNRGDSVCLASSEVCAITNEQVNDRSHRLARWMQREFEKLEVEQQTVFGQAVMLLLTKTLTLPTNGSPTSRTLTLASEADGTPAHQDRRSGPSGHVFPPPPDPVAYMERTNAPFRAFFESEMYPSDVPGADTVDREWPDDASPTLLRGALKRLQKSLAETAAGSAADTSHNVRLGLLTHEQALAMLDAYTNAPDPAENEGEDMLDARAMAHFLGVSEATVEKRFSEGRILGLERGDGSRVYPST